jgi:predicted RNA binding protein YcfA (HicA-like mRNA interferase family)
MKVRDVIKQIEEDGWIPIRTRGDHRQFKHPMKTGKVTITGQLGKDVPVGTLKSILKQAQIEG